MSECVNDGGPAFPMPSGPEPRVDSTTHYNEGMTLRDWFAGMALQGVVANPEAWSEANADACYLMADEMLEARKAVHHA